ncbi:MAG: prolyl oligopeptidase family serine peptidase [Gemmatimonadetes bacterium]|nr:prolyl oligopeptidase family serine peptidase [Gemmatimonadota bacterium]MBT5141434.1 prolyl oligopeptidase family serine peptidase [Gemmatimonadota bacterium]MBT5590667.1 prolyl oligopeptidase family serine peptidase [Gemmatimonadota bacterium]MBT5965198.1 prolyl oligopeptidase family serine peptidase [Gemmatimonadota bacterium]MBT7457540.1 prolyl oligopeptidase family serine peptidase [Gemmatimonadota bacterium]
MTERSRQPLLTTICLLALSVSTQAEQIEFSFTNSHDGTQQLAFAIVPDSLESDDRRPLLVLAHHAWGTRHSQAYYYNEIERRGWLLVVPELHGRHTDGRFSMAALEAQHDLIDAMEYMQAHYPVDSTRVYLAGRSMGGMLSAVTAAKYPGRFAAVVSGQGIYDVESWRKRSAPTALSSKVGQLRLLADSLLTQEVGGAPSPMTEYAYRRQSAATYVPNFQYVPTIFWHGTLDEIVPPQQTESLVAAIQAHDRFQPDPHWLQGASHLPLNLPASWVLDQLQHHQRIGLDGQGERFYPQLHLVTDEAKRILWLTIGPVVGEVFAEVQVSLTHDTLAVTTRDTEAVTIHLDRIPERVRFSQYTIEADRQVRVSVVMGDSVLFTATADQAAGDLSHIWSGRE